MWQLSIFLINILMIISIFAETTRKPDRNPPGVGFDAKIESMTRTVADPNATDSSQHYRERKDIENLLESKC
ncbi:unnamed protein product [Caenorhabditis angaria]|uniref:Secreted protein n=1 Tax=Caenorhabditis angaria TaxID=860376 RepID=A0A9P1IE12_9PELO|nr:unnamed protein product [Caenorhabditis angaria]